MNRILRLHSDKAASGIGAVTVLVTQAVVECDSEVPVGVVMIPATAVGTNLVFVTNNIAQCEFLKISIQE